MSQSRENYHNSTVKSIQGDLMDISSKVQNIKIVYCPTHEDIEENELADALAKIVSKKSKRLQPNTQLSPSEIHNNSNKITKIIK